MNEPVRSTANPPALAAADVLGDRLQAHLKLLVKALQPHVFKLERRFQTRLLDLGYSRGERRALSAVSTGAAVSLASSGSSSADFIEQVEYSGRRLAKLNVAPARIMRALDEYNLLLEAVLASPGTPAPGVLLEALAESRFCTVLSLNNAFREVAEAEAQSYHELFRIELESKGLDELLLRMLQELSRFCRAQRAALFMLDRPARAWHLRAAVLEGEPEVAAGEPLAGRLGASGAEALLSYERQHGQSRVTGEPLAGRLGASGAEALLDDERQHGQSSVAGETVVAGAGSLRRLSRGRSILARKEGQAVALHPAWKGLCQTCWSVPLVFEGRLAAVMQFGFPKPYEWLPREWELLSAAAERCSLAAEKARLLESLAAREEQVRRLAERLLQAEEHERRRITTELHDEAGQTLLCIRLQLELLERSVPEACPDLAKGLRETRALTESAILEIRRLLSSLSPAVLDQLGLAAALRQLRTRFKQLHKAQVTLNLAPPRNLSREIASAVYRLAQECLNNVAKHAAASRVNISLHSTDGGLRLCVEDNGVGFHVEEALAGRGSFGIAGMRERIALLGGKFQITSSPGRGTRLVIELPVEPRCRQTDPGS